MTLAYTSLHEDLGKLKVLARIEKGAPWLVIDRGRLEDRCIWLWSANVCLSSGLPLSGWYMIVKSIVGPTAGPVI